jgi:cytochrome c oxidase assembly protein subunit 15
LIDRTMTEPTPETLVPETRASGPLVHRLAVATALGTLALVVAGALVTSHDAGLAVPDWPTTYGYNMFTYPVSEMKGGIFYEHGHRLLGSLVGLLTVGLAIAVVVRERRRAVRSMAGAAVVLVIAQGVLGGLRVTRLDIDLAVVHGCVAQGFFALVAALAVVTHPSFAGLRRGPLAADATGLRAHSLVAAGLVYAQVVTGAFLRHRGARLDVHVGLALLVAGAIISLAYRACLPRSPEAAAPKPVQLPLLALSALVLLQLFLGLGSWATTFAGAGTVPGGAVEITLTVAHVAVGALILATAVTTSLMSFRLLGESARAGGVAARQVRATENAA